MGFNSVFKGLMTWKGNSRNLVRGIVLTFAWKDGGEPRNPLWVISPVFLSKIQMWNSQMAHGV